MLNDFFRIVVDAVDKRDGLINKFEGDAALAVFGAPLRVDGAASAALATARELADQLRKLPVADFGIGVSAGAVFAGNIGAENRYEYTVIGDPVNEAARLADLAKTSDERMLLRPRPSSALVKTKASIGWRVVASYCGAALKPPKSTRSRGVVCPARLPTACRAREARRARRQHSMISRLISQRTRDTLGPKRARGERLRAAPCL